MPKRTYVGSHAEVSLPDGTAVKKGSSVEVSEDTAKELDASGNWSKSKTASGEKE